MDSDGFPPDSEEDHDTDFEEGHFSPVTHTTHVPNLANFINTLPLHHRQKMTELAQSAIWAAKRGLPPGSDLSVFERLHIDQVDPVQTGIVSWNPVLPQASSRILGVVRRCRMLALAGEQLEDTSSQGSPASSRDLNEDLAAERIVRAMEKMN